MRCEVCGSSSSDPDPVSVMISIVCLSCSNSILATILCCAANAQEQMVSQRLSQGGEFKWWARDPHSRKPNGKTCFYCRYICNQMWKAGLKDKYKSHANLQDRKRCVEANCQDTLSLNTWCEHFCINELAENTLVSGQMLKRSETHQKQYSVNDDPCDPCEVICIGGEQLRPLVEEPCDGQRPAVH